MLSGSVSPDHIFSQLYMSWPTLTLKFLVLDYDPSLDGGKMVLARSGSVGNPGEHQRYGPFANNVEIVETMLDYLVSL